MVAPTKIAPNDLSPREWEALQFVSDPENWRPPHIAEVSRHLEHKNRRYGWELVTNLVRKGYLNTDLIATEKTRKHLPRAFKLRRKNA